MHFTTGDILSRRVVTSAPNRAVYSRAPGSHHFNRAAGKAKRHRPDCEFERLFEDMVDVSSEHSLFEEVLMQGRYLISVQRRTLRRLVTISRLTCTLRRRKRRRFLWEQRSEHFFRTF